MLLAEKKMSDMISTWERRPKEGSKMRNIFMWVFMKSRIVLLACCANSMQLDGPGERGSLYVVRLWQKATWQW